MQHCHYYFHDFIILYHTASFHLNITSHHIKTRQHDFEDCYCARPRGTSKKRGRARLSRVQLLVRSRARALGAKISASRAKVGKEDDQGWKTPSLQSNRAKKFWKMSSAVNVQFSRAQLSDGRSLRKRVCPYVAQWFTVTQFTVKILELVS